MFISPQPPTESNGVITLYTLQYRVTGSDEWNEILVPGANTNYTLTDLLSKTNYDIRVAAHTSAGMGPFSEGTTIIVDITGEWAPCMPCPGSVESLLVVEHVNLHP